MHVKKRVQFAGMRTAEVWNTLEEKQGYFVFLIWALNMRPKCWENIRCKMQLLQLPDALVSLGVVISGGLITLTDFAWIDPVVGLGIAAIIVCTSWSVFKESIVLILDGVPHGIDIEHLKQEIAGMKNVK